MHMYFTNRRGILAIKVFKLELFISMFLIIHEETKENCFCVSVALIRTFMFLGFTVIPPGGGPSGTKEFNDKNFLMVYNLD